MDSMMTNIYMNNNMAIGTNKNGNTVVNGSLAATKLPSNSNNLDNDNSSTPLRLTILRRAMQPQPPEVVLREIYRSSLYQPALVLWE